MRRMHVAIGQGDQKADQGQQIIEIAKGRQRHAGKHRRKHDIAEHFIEAKLAE